MNHFILRIHRLISSSADTPICHTQTQSQLDTNTKKTKTLGNTKCLLDSAFVNTHRPIRGFLEQILSRQSVNIYTLSVL